MVSLGFCFVVTDGNLCLGVDSASKNEYLGFLLNSDDFYRFPVVSLGIIFRCFFRKKHDSASKNEYQGFLLKVKAAGA